MAAVAAWTAGGSVTAVMAGGRDRGGGRGGAEAEAEEEARPTAAVEEWEEEGSWRGNH